jgi:hypothetical protein
MIELITMGACDSHILRVTYESRGETWVFCFKAENYIKPKQQAAVFAQSKYCNFSWHDAVRCNRLINRAVELVTHKRQAA